MALGPLCKIGECEPKKSKNKTYTCLLNFLNVKYSLITFIS